MTNIDLKNIRSLDGSQHKAFEQLCVQLAAHERPHEGGRFVPKGAPDAGVECYWTMPSGQEVAWQAKFFTAPPGRVQWRQVDDSVRVALAAHPALSRYIVCMPLDRADARRPGVRDFKRAWDEHVITWQRWAAEREMQVGFDYWGQTEILERLARDEHAGRARYWFDRDVLSTDWLRRHIADVLATAARRHSCDLHVHTNLEAVFEGLAGAPEYLDVYRRHVRELQHAWRRANDVPVPEALAAFKAELACDFERLLQAADRPIGGPDDGLPEDDVIHEWPELDSRVQEYARRLHGSAAGSRRQPSTSMVVGWGPTAEASERFRAVSGALQDLWAFVGSDAGRCANRRVLLLTGDAGVGKTHLLCEVARKRIAAGLPTLLVFGEQLSGIHPLDEIPQVLQLGNIRGPEFLGMLDSAGRAAGQRALLIVDGINESRERREWKTWLPSLITQVGRYRAIGLALSVRSAYEPLLIPEQFKDGDAVVAVEHPGFSGKIADEAIARFFEHYGLTLPATPLLNPEFHNPLFLHLVCRSAGATGACTLGDGSLGLLGIVKRYIDDLNARLADRLRFDSRKNLARKAASTLARGMADSEATTLPFERAEAEVNALLPGRTALDETLFRGLETEGLVSAVRMRNESPDPTPGIRFTYERLADVLMAERLIDEAGQPPFGQRTALGRLLSEPELFPRNQGVLDALALWLPEQRSVELADVLPQELRGHEAVRSAFLRGLPWRSPESIGERAGGLLDEALALPQGAPGEMWEALIALAARPRHPLNADYLDALLRGVKMPARDLGWSAFLGDGWGRREGPLRLIDWAWSAERARRADGETARLMATALCWFLTTSHRPVRDRATKALVVLLDGRTALLAQLLRRFDDCDDAYVRERLWCVAYGCAMRAASVEEIGQLAELANKLVFAKKETPPHILLRDYARGIVELAVHLKAALTFAPDAARPPYRSAWPRTAPSQLDLEAMGGSGGHDRNGRSALWQSVMGFGDFARYIIAPTLAKFALSQGPVEQRLPAGIRALLDGLAPGDRRMVLGASAFLPAVPTETGVFDPGFVQRWLMNRVLELGWTHEPPATPAASEYRADIRAAHKPERLGKKYQWIAFHEILARAADHFEFRDGGGREAPTVYEGPFQLHRRDIDPSFALPRPHEVRDPEGAPWWQAGDDAPLAKNVEPSAWLAADPFPEVASVLERQQPGGSSWLALGGYLVWTDRDPEHDDEPSPPGTRRLSLSISCAVLRLRDMAKLCAWARRNDEAGAWSPSSNAPGDFFLREFPWAPAVADVRPDRPERGGWFRERGGAPPVWLHTAADEYYWEAQEYDCSVDRQVTIQLPSRWLFETLGLRHGRCEGEVLDPSGNLLFWDPSVLTGGPSVLLCDGSRLLNALRDRGHGLVWRLHGEKWVQDDHRDGGGLRFYSGTFRRVRGRWQGRTVMAPEP